VTAIKGAKFKNLVRRTPCHPLRRKTTLFAAFNIPNGQVIGHCLPRHRGREFDKLVHDLEGEIPPELDIQLILDNYSTHKSPAVQRWLRPKKVADSICISSH
jgi:hypothetical protein